MQNQSEPGSRRLHVWRGRVLKEDTDRLSEAVAEKAGAELFNLNGSLVWLNEGQPVRADKNVLREIITRHIVSIRLVNRGTTDVPRWESEYYSFDFPLGADTSKEPSEQVLINLMNRLILLVARGPSEPFKLTPRQQEEVRARLKQGEPKDQIASAYSVDVDTIRSC